TGTRRSLKTKYANLHLVFLKLLKSALSAVGGLIKLLLSGRAVSELVVGSGHRPPHHNRTSNNPLLNGARTYQEVSNRTCGSESQRRIGFGAARNHGEIIALISGQDFSPLLRISWLKSAGIQSMKAGLKVGRSLTRSNQCSTRGSRPLRHKPSI